MSLYYNFYDPIEVRTSSGQIHASKFRYLIDFRTLTTRISKMQMQIIIDRFLRSEKSKEYKLNIYEQMLLTILASYMGKQINCWPSFKTLAENGKMSEKSVERYIKRLENKGLIKIEKSSNKNNEYEFTCIILPHIDTVSQTVSTVSQSVRAPSMRRTNNINNNINNNRKSYPQLKKWTGAHPTAEKPSELLDEFMKISLPEPPK